MKEGNSYIRTLLDNQSSINKSSRDVLGQISKMEGTDDFSVGSRAASSAASAFLLTGGEPISGSLLAAGAVGISLFQSARERRKQKEAIRKAKKERVAAAVSALRSEGLKTEQQIKAQSKRKRLGTLSSSILEGAAKFESLAGSRTVQSSNRQARAYLTSAQGAVEDTLSSVSRNMERLYARSSFLSESVSSLKGTSELNRAKRILSDYSDILED